MISGIEQIHLKIITMENCRLTAISRKIIYFEPKSKNLKLLQQTNDTDYQP